MGSPATWSPARVPRRQENWSRPGFNPFLGLQLSRLELTVKRRLAIGAEQLGGQCCEGYNVAWGAGKRKAVQHGSLELRPKTDVRWGMVAFRVLGHEGINPYQVIELPGVKVYSNYLSALEALRELERSGRRGAIMAIQSHDPFLHTDDDSPVTEILIGEDAHEVYSPEFGGGNFAILLGTDSNAYWEWANRGWWGCDENETRAKGSVIRHSRKLPIDFTYTYYYVIPGDQTLTPSPIPEPRGTPTGGTGRW